MIFDFSSAISSCLFTHFNFLQNCSRSAAPKSRYLMTSRWSLCKVSKQPAKHLFSVCFPFSPIRSRNDLSELISSRRVLRTPCGEASSLTSCQKSSGASRAARKQLWYRSQANFVKVSISPTPQLKSDIVQGASLEHRYERKKQLNLGERLNDGFNRCVGW